LVLGDRLPFFSIRTILAPQKTRAIQLKDVFYTVSQLSDRISETPEGFLVCEDVPILRAGDMEYRPDETTITAGDGPTILSRTIAEIHRPETLKSFEGKPITMLHPSDDGGSVFVTPENWKEHSVGIAQNVRKGEGESGDKVLCDFLITDAEAIDAVKTKRLREVSAGYSLKTIEVGAGRGFQRDIIGNHIALVPRGRAGKQCAIFDHQTDSGEIKMKTSLKDKVVGMFSKAFDESVTDEKDAEKAFDEINQNGILGEILVRLSSIESCLRQVVGEPMHSQTAPAVQYVLPGSVGYAVQTDAAPEPENQEDKAPEDEAPAEEKQEEPAHDQAAKCEDEDIISRAEILAPGVGDGSDVIQKSLDAAYSTTDGKEVIDLLLAGRSFDSADKVMLFIGASELIKAKRMKAVASTSRSFDTASKINATGIVTAERLNEINATIYKNK
jgi:hypothetical protein